MNQDYVSSSSLDGGVTLAQHMTRSFLWMAGGLAVTAVVSFVVLYSGLWYTIFSVPYSPFILLIAQLGVVIYLSGRLAKMKPATAKMLFMAYAVLTGINFSILPLAYGPVSYTHLDVYKRQVHQRADGAFLPDSKSDPGGL